MIEVAKAHERTCQEYQIHKQAHSMAPPSNYSNPLIQTSTLSKSFQKGPPKKTGGKCGCSHSHSDCPAHRTTCSKCGHLNHWATQNRRRWFSGKQPNKDRGCGGSKQRSSPNKKPGQGCGRGGGKPFKTNALTVTGLSRPAHPPKVSGEPFFNTFRHDALTSNGNELYEPPSNQGKAYTDTDSDGKSEISLI